MVQEYDIMAAYTEIFDGLIHLGPGDPTITRNLAERVGADLPAAPRVADFGCGAGASTLILAESLPGSRVLAVDAHAPFVARLESAAKAGGLKDRIRAVVGDMLEPPPLDGRPGGFHLIWSESAIYSIGRIKAFNLWRPLLNPGGWLVFSEIVWQRKPSERSEAASAFWAKEYPEISTAGVVTDELTAAGFTPADPVWCDRKPWSNYYKPLRARLHDLARRRNRPRALIELMSEMQREIDIYDHSGDDVAVCFFLARLESNIG